MKVPPYQLYCLCTLAMLRSWSTDGVNPPSKPL